MKIIPNNRKTNGYSLIETMTTIAVIAIVLGLLFGYSDSGWKLFYQTYSRGLSQVKAKLAIRILSEDLKEANRNRISIGRGTSYGVPLPDDIANSSPFMYFTKPIFDEKFNKTTAYNYILYYFAKPNYTQEELKEKNQRNFRGKEKYLTLKVIKFLNQSKFYTEDESKKWPFPPPIIELRKSQLPEDLEALAEDSSEEATDPASVEINTKKEEELFIDHFSALKKESRNIPISGNFSANALTDPFSTDQVTISFGQDYKINSPIKVKVSIEETPVLLSLMSSISEFEVFISPRN